MSVGLTSYNEVRRNISSPKSVNWLFTLSVYNFDHVPKGTQPNFQMVIATLDKVISKLHRELGRVSNFNQSIIWHHHTKDHVESCQLTMFDVFRVNRDYVMDLETLLQTHTNVSVYPKSIKLVKWQLYTWSFMWWCTSNGQTFYQNQLFKH